MEWSSLHVVLEDWAGCNVACIEFRVMRIGDFPLVLVLHVYIFLLIHVYSLGWLKVASPGICNFRDYIYSDTTYYILTYTEKSR